MQDIVTQLLPSLPSLGMWGYWLVAALVLAQGFAPTSAFSPASVVVVFVGGLCAHGVYDLGDMIWFVALADAVGGELTYRLGRRAHAVAKRHFFPASSLSRGRALFDKFGGPGIVLGRFLPMGAFVPMVAGMTRMDRRKFHLWNLIGAFAYAVAALLVGYFFGSVAGLFGATTTRVGLLVAALLAVLALIWFLAVQLARAWPFMRSVLGSILRAVAENEDVKAMVARHPRLGRFIAARLSTTRYSGLPTTLFAVAFAYFSWLYASTVLDVVQGGVIVRTDQRLAQLLYAFRDPTLVRFFAMVSAFGNSRAVVAMAIVTSVLLWRAGQRRQIVALWLVPIGASMTTVWLKLVFARPRPELAVFQLSDFSFPSGHATGAVAFFGLLAWLAFRNGWLRPGGALVLAAVAIFLIGFSRLYLDVHYLSDVLNGYLVGGMWLLGGIWALEWRQDARPVRRGSHPPAVGWRLGALALYVAIGLAAGLSKPQVAKAIPPPRLSNLDMPVAQALTAGIFPKYSESILGDRQEPISLVVLAPDRQAFLDLMAAAGWRRADPPTIANVSHALFAAWLGQPYDAGPMTPSFWNARPHDFGFEKATAADNLRQRHHARFWESGVLSPEGLMIFVGTASFDSGLKWGITHHIAPNIDAERDLLAQDLVATGKVALRARVRLVAPVLGQNMSGDAFFTDGVALVLAPAQPR